tara:strand:- start:41 stop:430 length:390 start_codon:yes stop_codon:yes gene_type:complete
MQARLTTVEAEEAQQKQELNTFYLMWAGRGALHAHHLAAPPLCCATRAHYPIACSDPQLLRASCVRLLLRFACVVRWLCAAALIFLMQAGFATLSAGSIRAKNVSNILLKASLHTPSSLARRIAQPTLL